MRFAGTTLLIGAAALCVVSAGCVVNDKGGSRGQSGAPTATVPDTGSPLRRASPSETLNSAEPSSPATGDVKVDKP